VTEAAEEEQQRRITEANQAAAMEEMEKRSRVKIAIKATEEEKRRRVSRANQEVAFSSAMEELQKKDQVKSVKKAADQEKRHRMATNTRNQLLPLAGQTAKKPSSAAAKVHTHTYAPTCKAPTSVHPSSKQRSSESMSVTAASQKFLEESQKRWQSFF